MNKIQKGQKEPRVYYVHGSGLIGIPSQRMNEISELRSEFHEGEAKKAMLLALNRRIS